jgi:hypothetical protein
MVAMVGKGKKLEVWDLVEAKECKLTIAGNAAFGWAGPKAFTSAG